MRISFSIFKPIALSIVAIVVLGLGQGVVRADEVFIQGNTLGCFGVACVPGASSTLLGLTYNNSTFDGTTAGGFLGIGNTATPPGNVDNLGSMTLTAMPALYTGQVFTLRVTFTDPDGIILPGDTVNISVVLMGQVITNDVGGVTLDFDNTPILFTFNDTTCGVTTIPGQQTTCGAGSFMFRVNDVSIQSPEVGTIRVVPVTGDILSAQQTSIPEPTSMLLLGTGLAGAAGALRRKLRARKLN
jgi:hypothetical protein